MNFIGIDLKNTEDAALFALEEFKRYLKLFDKTVKFRFDRAGITLKADPELFAQEGIRLEDPELDDAVFIEVENGSGVIAGSNPRALLIAVYKFFALNGAVFVKPGPNGEIIPEKPAKSLGAKYLHAASYRHRGVCIEGAVSIENVLDMIEWLPKVGMNAYFTQFLTPGIFFQRYYGRYWNPSKTPEPLSKTIVDGFVRRIVAAAKERGLIYHGVGHGWTCEPLGIPGTNWSATKADVPEEAKKYFALINGERELWHGVALNTNLCYSNPEVCELVTDYIRDYAKAHPQTDVIHFWLADGSNNQCECEDCAGHGLRPSDYYVRMLNLLDKKLTAAGLPTKIVFLIYVDLLWRPTAELLENGDRFILMFAPITRKYSEPFRAGSDGKTIPFELNRLKLPGTVEDSLAYLREWQETLPACDSFLFDYHFMWDYIREAGSYSNARVLFEDMKGLADLGLNGMVSCQNQRVFHPSALGMQGMAAALWDKDQSFDEFSKNFFSSAFGGNGAEVEKYLKGLSEAYPGNTVRHNDPPLEGPESAERFAAAAEYCVRMRPRLKALLSAAGPNPCIRQNYKVLLMHNYLTAQNAKLFSLCASGKKERAAAAFERLKALANRFEDKMQSEFDMELYLSTVCGRSVKTERQEIPPLLD